MTGDDGETVCPYCRKNSAMIYVDGSARLVSGPGLPGEAAFQCYSCKRFVIGGRHNLGLLTPRELDPRMQAWGLHERSTPADIAKYLVGHVEYWEPVSPVGRTIENVPPEIASAVDEAYRCMSIGAFRASVLMARGVIEAGAKASGVTKGTLASKIDELAKQNLIRPLVAESAHEVRHVGNDVAHGDFAVAEVAKDDVEDVLELMEEIVQELFVLPTRVQRRKSRRIAPDA